MERYLDPTNDVGFKKVFSNAERLTDFLNNILRLPVGKKIKKLDFVPTEEIPDLGQGKRSLFDLKCQDESGTYFLIEMQCRRSPLFLKRMQYYGAHAYTSQIGRGTKHAGLLPVVVVAILKEAVFPAEVEVISYHRTLEEKTGQHHLRELSYVIVELEKFHKKVDQLQNFEDEWLFFLKDAHSSSSLPVLKDRLVTQAFETMEKANWKPEEYDAYIRALLLLETEELKAESDRAEGKAEGKAESQLQTASNMLELGLEDIIIAKATGLSLEQIKKLR